MLRTILLTTLFSLFLGGCLTAPKATPEVYFCTIDLPRSQLICSLTGQPEGSPPVGMRVPLMSADKYVSFSPMDWEIIANYIDYLKIQAGLCGGR